MKKILTLALLAMFGCGPAFAADEKAAPKANTQQTNTQQTKMATCQAQATEKKLESKARQEFLNNCLKAKPVAEKPKSKMAMCNEKTKGMNKAEADKSRSECLKG
ncbi:MAG TPA: PsiF family protein [Casimicrobiaceae bacterium]|nr:PsiF family protein [Casimicrobiaceae bacterium]